jgi:hypothetical protein
MENPNGEERFPLDEAAITIIAELRESAKAAQVSLNAILTYFARQHGLKGNYQLADNGRELVLRPAPQGVIQQ